MGKQRFEVMIGWLIIVGTHVWILINKGLPENQSTMHAVINLVGAGLLYYGLSKKR